ncbi:uncharacterized protein VTP21DRAFT_10895 [Calcarisporiella thermophila]|uniref:uncharacterized protein n=1 Tax=Calcarisporiella thermophila TaxID=911321 RepID=UPI003741ECE9
MDLYNELPDRLLFAVPKKGRLYERCLALLEGADIQFHRKNRLDIALVTNLPLALVFLPAADIPAFVASGNVELGITGQDMVAESQLEGKVQVVCELGFGKCRLCVQTPTKGAVRTVEDLVGKRVVTSFENLAKNFFDKLEKAQGGAGGKTEITYVSGSVEAACALGLADGIVDLVESGETMKAAGLTDVATLLTSQAVLIQRHSPKHPELVNKIASRIRGVIAASRYVYCDYNIERKNLERAVKLTPGRQAPTISSLEEEGWVAVSSMVLKDDIAQVMDGLEGIGARDILVFNISNCRV